jgi:DNA-binding transcriptional ArsR family regulator
VDPVQLLDEPERVRTALSPVRRQLLERLREPGSATTLAAQLETSRQRVNYHLKALEAAGLVELVEERQRRGFTERVVRARATALLVDPDIALHRGDERSQDRFAAEHLLDAATGLVRDVARMQAAADAEGSRLMTFTLDTEIAFARPADLEAFVLDLAAAVEELGRRHGAGRSDGADERRPYRVVVGGHPAPRQETQS